MKSSLDATVLRIKVNNYFGGIGISHEESICILKEKGVFCVRVTVTRICVGAVVKFIFPYLEFMV